MIATQIKEDRQIAKLHVNKEIADLVKIFCVLNNKKMIDFTTEVLSRELENFKKKLEQLRSTN